jgi:hypothetical protein
VTEAPSCGKRRSAMLRPAMILMREMTAWGGASGNDDDWKEF